MSLLEKVAKSSLGFTSILVTLCMLMLFIPFWWRPIFFSSTFFQKVASFMLPASFWLNALWEDSAALIVAACLVQPRLPLPWWHIKSRWQHKFERALTTVDWGFQPDAWHAERPQPWGWLFHRLWLSFLRGCLMSKPCEWTEKKEERKIHIDAG